MKTIVSAVSVTVLGLLAGCGGGGSDQPAASSVAVSSVAATAPSITGQPQNTAVIAGQDANFSVTATGTGTLTYQWKRGGTAVAGATSASYRLAAAKAEDGGASFSVDVSNSAGLVTSSAAVLTVNVPPAIVAQPAAASVASGQSVTFSVTATGTAPLVYQWKKGGQNISGATAASMTLSATALLHGAQYTVSVTNIAGTVSSAAVALRIVPPIQLLAGTLGGAGNLDGPLANARLGSAGGMTYLGNDILVTDPSNNKIRKINLTTNTITTFAGNGTAGSADGAALTAQFNMPAGITRDATGNVYVADSGNSTIRKITPEGVVSTLAGVAKTVGLSDGAGALALFKNPYDITIARDGNLYVADTGNHAVRRVTLSGAVVTIAGGTGAGSTNGAGASAKFSTPSGITPDCLDSYLCTAGAPYHLYVADTANNMIRDVLIGGTVASPTYTVSTLAGATTSGSADGSGTAARFDHPTRIVFARAQNVFVGSVLYVADSGGCTVRAIVGSVVTTFAGKAGECTSVDGSVTAARFNSIGALSSTNFSGVPGDLHIADSGALHLASSGTVTVVAGIPVSTGNKDGTGTAARFNIPGALATDATGNLYAADIANKSIRKISPAGATTTLGTVVFPFGITIDSAGTVWVVEGDSLKTLSSAGITTAFSGKDSAGVAVQLMPMALAADDNGNIFVAEQCQVRKISSAGVVSSVAGSNTCGYVDGSGAAARFSQLSAIATDASGTLFVADNGSHVVRKITSTGVASTLAGSPGVTGFADGIGPTARFGDYMDGIAAESSGTIYVTDTKNSAVRQITVGGAVTTIAGNPNLRGIQPGNLPGSLNSPSGIAVLPGSSVSLAIADSAENAIITISIP